MRDDVEPVGDPDGEIMSASHGRILALMAILGVAGSLAGGLAHSTRFGVGVLIGSALAFASYFWLKYSLKKVFAETADGERPRVSAIRYLARYFTLGGIIAVIFATDIVPIIAVLLGMAGFGFAVVADGTIRIFTSFFNRKEL